jgi:hypothetical protein
MIGRLAAELLRRHVPHRPKHHARLRAGAGLRDCTVRYLARPRGWSRLDQLGEAEVENLHVPRRRHEHVVRLQVAMDDPLFMRGRQTASHLDGAVDGLAHRHPAADRTPERSSLE